MSKKQSHVSIWNTNAHRDIRFRGVRNRNVFLSVNLLPIPTAGEKEILVFNTSISIDCI